jgi:hypothetical protein
MRFFALGLLIGPFVAILWWASEGSAWFDLYRELRDRRPRLVAFGLISALAIGSFVLQWTLGLW